MDVSEICFRLFRTPCIRSLIGAFPFVRDVYSPVIYRRNRWMGTTPCQTSGTRKTTLPAFSPIGM